MKNMFVKGSLGNARIQIAVEDRFVVVRFDENLANEFSQVLKHLSAGFPEYTLLCDCRDVTQLTERIADGIIAVCWSGIPAICLDSNSARIEGTWRYALEKSDPMRLASEGSPPRIPLLKVRTNEAHLNYASVRASVFEDVDPLDFLDYRNPQQVSKEEISFVAAYAGLNLDERLLGTHDSLTDEEVRRDNEGSVKGLVRTDAGLAMVVTAHRRLRTLLQRNASNSLLTTYTIQLGGDQVLYTPYHSRAIHAIEAGEAILLGRPGIVANKTNAVLRPQLRILESLLEKQNLRENEIQQYLECNPAVLKALGYANIYPQVILQRDDGTSLRPDFIVEPTSDEWCDIVEIKLPDVRVAVGTRDRKTLAAAIHELVAQLREYAAYFENEKWARRIEELYGIKCYRPRLVGVVGSDPRLEDDRQLRRLMTAYSDVKVLTFDQMLRHAKMRLLI
jgi:hypothetical protein